MKKIWIGICLSWRTVSNVNREFSLSAYLSKNLVTELPHNPSISNNLYLKARSSIYYASQVAGSLLYGDCEKLKSSLYAYWQSGDMALQYVEDGGESEKVKYSPHNPPHAEEPTHLTMYWSLSKAGKWLPTFSSSALTRSLVSSIGTHKSTELRGITTCPIWSCFENLSKSYTAITSVFWGIAPNSNCNESNT